MTNDNTDMDKEFLSYLCTHLISLGVVYGPKEASKRNDVHPILTSCFVMELGDEWFLTTAGHVLGILDDLVAKYPDNDFRYFIADFFGRWATILSPFHFDYPSSAKMSVFDNALGIDFGVIRLSAEEKTRMQRNGVVPVKESNWGQQQGVSFTGYGMVGFPLKEFKPDFVGGSVRPIFVRLNKAESRPNRLCSHRYPMFYGEIIESDTNIDINGMSGCPVLGFVEGEGDLQCYFIGLQSGWLKKSGVTYACSMSFLGSLLRKAVGRGFGETDLSTLLDDDDD